MHLDVVAVLVVFCIAFTVSFRSDTPNNEFVPQPLRHGRRHHRHDEKYLAKNKDRNRNSNSNNNNNHRHPNNDNNNNRSNRKRSKQNHANQWPVPRHLHHNSVNNGLERGPQLAHHLSTLLHNQNINNNNNYNNNNNRGSSSSSSAGDVMQGNGGPVAECCPSETRMVELVYGISRNNTLLEIYNNATKPQRFYEVVCAPNVTNRTCRFVEASLQPYSSCVERFTYTYAIVRDSPIQNSVNPVHRPNNAEWRLDYIRIPSGCFCEFRNFSNR